MNSKQAVYLGVDLTGSRKPFTYAALDLEMRLLALGQGQSDEVLAFAAGQSEALVAIDAPSGPNRGLMAQPEFRSRLSPALAPGRWTNLRLAEYRLHQQGVSITRTPSTAEESPEWMRLGFELYHKLGEMGYRAYPDEGAPRQWLEGHAEASFQVLLERVPFEKSSVEGRLQRQLILQRLELPVEDPMDYFEELTRHKLLHGILPLEKIHSPSELNALILAYLAWLAVNKPQEVVCVGDPQEGQIYTPAGLQARLF
jgi:predicted nuclease with RNAse H fold